LDDKWKYFQIDGNLENLKRHLKIKNFKFPQSYNFPKFAFWFSN